jgi:nanoRNase/pAp phosphatase (c-di-AMP/oligoRNAs hydrolase)
MLRVLERLDCKARLFFCGGFSHPQNRSIINKYDLQRRMKPISEIKLNEGRPHYEILVDSSLTHDGRLGEFAGKLNVRICVDHHRASDLEETDDSFIWIEDVGSCATLMVELMRDIGYEFTDDDRALATVLTLGVYTDTKALAGASPRDLNAYAFTRQNANTVELDALIDYDLPSTFFKNMATALAGVKRSGSRLVTGVGFISQNEGDDLSTIADLLMRQEGVELVIVWGVVNDFVRVSARNTNMSLPLDDFLKRRFGPKSGAKLTPGGHGEGGAKIELPLGFWIGQSNREAILEMVALRMGEECFNGED